MSVKTVTFVIAINAAEIAAPTVHQKIGERLGRYGQSNCNKLEEIKYAYSLSGMWKDDI